MTIEHLKCGWSELKYAISIKRTFDFQDSTKKKGECKAPPYSLHVDYMLK